MSTNYPSLLPEPSILQKLKSHDPQAPEKIMRSAEQIGEARRTSESVSLAAAFSRSGFLRLSQLVNGVSSPLQTQDATSAMRSDWARVGDSMRRAISAYMDEHKLTADALKLNVQERASLVLAYPDPAPEPAKTSFFRKIFPKL